MKKTTKTLKNFNEIYAKIIAEQTEPTRDELHNSIGTLGDAMQRSDDMAPVEKQMEYCISWDNDEARTYVKEDEVVKTFAELFATNKGVQFEIQPCNDDEDEDEDEE